MRKLLLSLALVGPLLFAVIWTADAADPVIPAVTRIEPASAFNDIDTRVTITGADFAVDASVTPTAAPVVTLGTTPLADVTWVDTQTLSATVPWSMDPGAYDLTVTNPDGGTATLPDAFTVSQGIGQWNAGELNGASVAQLLLKPGDPNTVYALAYDVGLYRSRDAGVSWAFTSATVIGNAYFAVDPSPGHESWLYSYMWDGLHVSKDEGATWTMLLGKPGEPADLTAEVFVSPHTPDRLFLATSRGPSDALGLQVSGDGGLSWAPVPSMEGTAVLTIAFDPAPGSHGMVLATSDARIFSSADEGDTWTEVAKPPLAGMGMRGSIAYNPFKPGEVWLSSTETDGGMYKSTGAGMTGWTDVAPWAYAGYAVTFTGPESVYIWHQHSDDGGETWHDWGPWPWWGGGTVTFPDPADTQTAYITDAMRGVQKTTDGGRTWSLANQGLRGMRCRSLEASKADPLRVYAAFDAWPGVYRSDNGTTNWTYFPIEGSGQVWQVREDPFDPERLFASGDGGFYVGASRGETWTALGWNLPAGSPTGMFNVLEPDPHQPGHLLVASRIGTSSFHDHDIGLLYSSTDHGESWQAVPVITPIDSLDPITDIAFDPETTGTVYLTTNGSGVYKSTDSGDTWARVDDLAQPMMQGSSGLAIATHPRRVVLVVAPRPFISLDDGATWHDPTENVGMAPSDSCLFVDSDSTRLYGGDIVAEWSGLYFSGDVGATWTRAAGILGHIQVTALAYADADGHTILYAATSGGDAGAGTEAAVTSRVTASAAAPSTMVGAGIYRRAQVETTVKFHSSGTRDGWIAESRERSSAGGSLSAGATTLRLGDTTARRQYRSVLSFSTGPGLPNGAVITKVTLRVKRQGVTGGGDPVAKFGGFLADIKKGYFGSSTALRTSDFQAAASRAYGAFRPAAVGGWYSIDLTGARAYVNRTSTRSGLTQIRLRFKSGDNNNAVANYLRLYSGNASSASRPDLIVSYYVP